MQPPQPDASTAEITEWLSASIARLLERPRRIGDLQQTCLLIGQFFGCPQDPGESAESYRDRLMREGVLPDGARVTSIEPGRFTVRTAAPASIIAIGHVFPAIVVPDAGS